MLAEYSNYTDVFSFDLAIEIPENTSINKYTTKVVEGKQLLYKHIYVFSPVELETLKTYIKTYQKTEFIWPSKSPAITPILYDKKPDGIFCLYMNYQG